MRRILAATLALSSLAAPAPAQTVQGDILRGQGRYLEGAGWYNLNTARAGRINVETWKAANREAQRLYHDYMVDRSKRIDARKGLTNKLQADIQKRLEENQRRWREDPTPADIASGDALNALAGDLADPDIAPSVWGGATVPLPTGVTLTALAFKIADPKKSTYQQSTVAVDRMLVKDGWPLPFRRPEVAKQCAAYEKSVTSVVEKCRKGTELQGADYDRLRATVTALRDAVEVSVPLKDDQRTQAREYVGKLNETTRIFAEQAYAEQLVRDVSEHKATTVAELLAFMRDYRLMFADPGNSPEVTSLYDGLYGLLRRQKDALGLGKVANRGGGGRGGAGAPSDAFAAGTVWSNGNQDRPLRMRVTERQGGRFKAMLIVGDDRDVVLEINGQVGPDTISWKPADVTLVKAPQGKAQAKTKGQARTKGQGPAPSGNVGTFKGQDIHFVNGPGGRPGGFVLHKGR